MADDLKEGSDDFSQTPLLHQFLGSRQLRSQKTEWQELCMQLLQLSKHIETNMISRTRERDDLSKKIETYQTRQHDLQNELQALEKRLNDTEKKVDVQRQEKEAAIQDREAAIREKIDAIKDKERDLQNQECAIYAARQDTEAAVNEAERAKLEKDAALQAKESAIKECNKLREDLRQAEEKQYYREEASDIELDTMDQPCSHNEVAKIWDYKRTIELLESRCRENAIEMSKYQIEIDRQRREQSDVIHTSRLEVEALQADVGDKQLEPAHPTRKFPGKNAGTRSTNTAIQGGNRIRKPTSKIQGG